ncbi:MAG: bifunctional diaminohydroxyphosphoribosylaminopyrimidine deaminase/5-amino-6-(5-phosphoribosylamino)uracil reductase RibD [Cetobacterium sp.]|nr:bifunctional diaminohydroxyphosphoribosylaminopyrimidine deaminase/5-amino-6-(5-phosphoribosylamino)uracil reductase RibD [Cetobacterium sp.]
MDFNDSYYMNLALTEARKGEGKVNPNPLVGAVVVKNNKILGIGYHKVYGSHHAEVNALNMSKNSEGATIYVTLEPCSHQGKTPPCVDKIIQEKIKKCVIGTLDPNPLVSGSGVKKLQEAGIEVIVGILEEEALKLNEVFFKYIKNKNPYIFLKCGITLDGKIATRDFSSKWITNSLAREKVQYYRNKFMGIFVGTNTVLKDNPSLTCTLENKRDPFRITIDKNLEIPIDYKIIANNFDEKTIFIIENSKINSEKYNLLKNKYKIKFISLDEKDFSLEKIFKKVGEFGIDSILVEGGSSIISQIFENNLYDSGEFFIAPKILGDEKSIPFINGFSKSKIDEAFKLNNVKFNLYGNNIGLEFSK